MVSWPPKFSTPPNIAIFVTAVSFFFACAVVRLLPVLGLVLVLVFALLFCLARVFGVALLLALGPVFGLQRGLRPTAPRHM